MSDRGTAVATALLLCGAALAIAGCGLGAGKSVGSVDLTVTREFGAVSMSRTSGEADESDTVMRFLEGKDEIETRYGGGYVKSIDGVSEDERGGHPYDWFFYVDGVESPVGAAQVSLSGGEQVWWDNHDWSATEHIPAVVGSWPAPFTTGWEGHAPKVDVECEGGGAACGEVSAALRREGAKLSENSAKDAIRVLVGPWERVRSDPAAALVEGGPAESGVYADFERTDGSGASAGDDTSADDDGGAGEGAGAGGDTGAGENVGAGVSRAGGWELVALDENGGKARSLGVDAGLVAATRHFEGPPVWLVTGGTTAAVRAAAGALDARDLRDHFAVASEAGKVTPLPLDPGSG